MAAISTIIRPTKASSFLLLVYPKNEQVFFNLEVVKACPTPVQMKLNKV